MAIDVTMPALSPTMEVGKLAKWHVKLGQTVKSGDIIAEIETDKATMEVEAVDEGTVIELAVPEGLENVPVGTVILRLAGEGEAASPAPKAAPVAAACSFGCTCACCRACSGCGACCACSQAGDRVIASPLARRIAEMQGVDLDQHRRQRPPHGRIVRADVEAASGKPVGCQCPCADRPARLHAELRWRHALPYRKRLSPATFRTASRKARQCPQGHRPPPDRGQAVDPAHLPHARCRARCAAETAR
jgi:pyruvate dehydrogenase E2 component (dihydrolipoamide acetyltransferase)